MAGSETGVMTSSGRVEPFGLGLQKSSPQQPMIQNMRLAFSSEGSAVYKPVTNNNSPSYQPSSTPIAGSVGGGGGGGVVEGSASGGFPPYRINVNAGSGGEGMKKKRGRPRKYGPDGSMATMHMAIVPATQPQQQQQNGGGGSSGGGGFASSPSPPATAVASGGSTAFPGGGATAVAGGGATAAAPPSQLSALTPASSSGTTKKARGRPPGSSNKKHHVQAMGPTGFGFTPHMITVKAGEDLSSQIMSFSQHGPRAICILSANGAISNVTLRQASTSGGTVTYEGRFEILSLSGSFMPSESGGHWGRTGGLSVALSDSDGRVLGGGVAGLLIAATPIQLVVASFISEGEKEPKSLHYMESLTATGRLNPAGGRSPPSRGTHSESSGGPGSPVHQNSGAYNSHPQGISWK
ncbi:AT-hook motif nuclear-localized protein 10 [Euphorbia lathyris]|uniref:AT-hook motif nuclear-localized protein 10 n=1 Tax=Euphorbia lathyris TaxID=212925 RepID=UPI003313FE4C